MALEIKKVQRILVIKLRAIGDVLLSTVVLKNLREAFPRAKLDFLTEKSSREVIEGNHNVNSVIVFDGKHQSSLGLILNVRGRNYDLVLDLFGNPRSAIVTYFSGATYRVGYRFGWRRYCYNTVVTPRGGDVHNTEFNLDALRAIGLPIGSDRIEFPLTIMAEHLADEYFNLHKLTEKFTVALNPGGGWYTKRWRIPEFAQLGDLLVREWNAKVLVAWGPGELEDAKKLKSSMKESALLLPQSSLKQLAAILKRCSVFVTNDSGPMHIAAAVGTPVVAIFGPTDPELQGPIGTKHEVVQNERLLCLGCNFTDCPIGNPCMLELSVEEVMNGVRRVVEKNKLTVGKHPA